MPTTAQKLTDVLGFDADDPCSVTPYCAHIIADGGTVEEHHYIVIVDNNCAWAADPYYVNRWLDAGGSDYQDLCDSVKPLHNVQIALDYFNTTGGVLTGHLGGVVASHADLAALADIDPDATIGELACDADTNRLLWGLFAQVEAGVLSPSLNAREAALRSVEAS